MRPDHLMINSFLQVADALYYNAPLALNVLQKLNIATEMFNLWFQMLEQTKKSGVRANFKRYALRFFSIFPPSPAREACLRIHIMLMLQGTR